MCRAFEEKYQEGRLEGRLEGRQEERYSIARKLLAAGKLALEEIAEYSSLPLDEVKQLRRSMP